MSSSETLLEVRHLSKKFADSEPLRDVNCSVRRGEVISIIGSSGTGKSTFLRCINRPEKPSGGQIFFCGEEITDEPAKIRRLRQKIGMVFRSFKLFSNMNALAMEPEIILFDEPTSALDPRKNFLTMHK